MNGEKNLLPIVGALLLIVLFSTIAFVPDVQAQDESEFACKKDTSSDSEYFQEIQQEARKINQAFCDLLTSEIPSSNADMDAIAIRLRLFAELVHDTVKSKMTLASLNNMVELVASFSDEVIARADDPRGLPSMLDDDKSVFPNINITFSFTSDLKATFLVDNDNNGDCKILDSVTSNCKAYLRDLKDAIYPYQINFNAKNVYTARVQLQALSDEWDRFFETGRYQNSIGIALTTWAERSHFAQDHLVGPPARQWHSLQPNLVIESVPDADDGDNIEYALSIEWIGVNWWKDSPIGIPFGISLASIYADRPGIEDVGHGVMFTFANQYTIGVADHDGDQGVYVTLDLLKLFMDKEAQLQKYRDDLGSVLD